MKYLILMLLSFNSFADFKINIVNSKTGQSFGDNKETLQAAQEWIDDNNKVLNGKKDLTSWGLKKRWVRKTNQVNCLQERDIVPEIGQAYSECQLQADYTICGKAPDVVNIAVDCEDITQSVADEKEKKLRIKNRRNEIRSLMLLRTLSLQELTELERLKEGIE
jgi:hypothetical protein